MKLTRRQLLYASAMLLHPGSALSNALPKNKTLVVIELQGGNDGLNTVVPVSDPLYKRLRPNLALPRDRTIELNHTTGLHHAFTPLTPAWDNGELAIVQGLGYDNPNRSHFRSTDIWASASDAAVIKRSGWLNDALSDSVGEKQLAALVFSGRDLSVRGGAINVISVKTLADLQNANPGQYLGQSGNASAWLHRVSDLTRRFKETMPTDLPVEKASYPKGALANQLRDAASLIKANVAPPVIGAHLNGFDTHANQSGRHNDLLKQLASALAAMRKDLMNAGYWRETLIMTVSEFGRRASENGSSGTDHGTAAPQFLIGGRVNGGLHGSPSELDNLQNDDMVHKLDFRTMYASVMEQWLEIDSIRLNDERFQTLPLVRKH